MALIDIDKLKKNINKLADDVANTVSGAAKNVGDGVSEFSTNIIVKILNGVDIDAVLKATETSGNSLAKTSPPR